MDFLSARFSVTQQQPSQHDSVLDVAMIGHCPGRFNRADFLNMPQLQREIRFSGNAEKLDALLEDESYFPYNLPIPVYARSEFRRLFPDAHDKGCQYYSTLAGDKAWLPLCVDDFFANGGQKLWVVIVPEEQEQLGFYSPTFVDLTDTASLTGIATTLVLNNVGIVCLPDLERLQIEAHWLDIAHLRLENPNPEFVPCSTDWDDGHRERRNSDELKTPTSPVAFINIVENILVLLAKKRPDMMCLFSLPMLSEGSETMPTVDSSAIATLQSIKSGSGAHQLRHLQLIFPYLQNPQGSLLSAVGLIAGRQSAVSDNEGPWRSIAAKPFACAASIYPPLSKAQQLQLRNEYGVTVVHGKPDSLQLDDERLAVSVLPDASGSSSINAGLHSAEVMRFMGHLRRQLTALGNQIIFNSDYRDPQPKLMVEHFLRQLFHQGALRGDTADAAFRVSVDHSREGVIAFDIEVAPSFPIDRIKLKFTNEIGSWSGVQLHV
jgi:hypothetical protein